MSLLYIGPVNATMYIVHTISSYEQVCIYRLHTNALAVLSHVIYPRGLIISTLGPRHGFLGLKPPILYLCTGKLEYFGRM